MKHRIGPRLLHGGIDGVGVTRIGREPAHGTRRDRFANSGDVDLVSALEKRARQHPTDKSAAAGDERLHYGFAR